jgi:hypothetical protein
MKISDQHPNEEGPSRFREKLSTGGDLLRFGRSIQVFDTLEDLARRFMIRI